MIYFSLFYFVAIALFLKNLMFSGVVKNSFFLVAMCFYPIGLLSHKVTYFSLLNFTFIILISCLLNVFVSMSVKAAFIFNNPEFILVGSKILGGSFGGALLGRGTGFSIPLLL